MTPKVMQRFIKMGTEQKANLGLYFGNLWKEILEQIEPDCVHITGVYDEEIQ